MFSFEPIVGIYFDLRKVLFLVQYSQNKTKVPAASEGYKSALSVCFLTRHFSNVPYIGHPAPGLVVEGLPRRLHNNCRLSEFSSRPPTAGVHNKIGDLILMQEKPSSFRACLART